jgi:2-phospho-L-lactate guanylyltransferase
MKTVLLPVKDFRQAKQRLAPTLSPTQRAGLARAMLLDVLRALAESRRPERIVVYTACDEVGEVVRPFKFEVVWETAVSGHSDAVNFMVEQLSTTASRILSLAGDLPTVTPLEIDGLFDSSDSELTLVSSRDGTGTNAALFVLPARIPMQYGDNSLQRHLATARARKVRATVAAIPGMQFDIDNADDLKAYVDRGPVPSSFTWRFVASL